MTEQHSSPPAGQAMTNLWKHIAHRRQARLARDLNQLLADGYVKNVRKPYQYEFSDPNGPSLYAGDPDIYGIELADHRGYPKLGVTAISGLRVSGDNR